MTSTPCKWSACWLLLASVWPFALGHAQARWDDEDASVALDRGMHADLLLDSGDVDLAPIADAEFDPLAPGAASLDAAEIERVQVQALPAPGAEVGQPSPLWGTPVPVAVLQSQRGGFETPQGLQLSFGLTRQVYLNGVLQSTQTWQMGALNPAVTEAGQGAITAAGALSALLVQNRANDQQIRTLTVIDAQLNSLRLLGAARLEHNVRSAVIDSIRR